MREIIQEEIGRFEMTDPYPKKNGYVGENPVMLFEDFVQYLNDLEEDLCKRYSGITCELRGDWAPPHWLVIYGKRYETKEEEQARLDKEKSAAEKKEAKRLARIKKLEQELKELKDV